MLIALVSFLAVIAVVIITHELGHFITAKASGVRVDEFGLGFPPRLFGIKRGQTLYSLNALPFGGFVKMAGEEDPKAADSLAGKSIATRLLVLSAGSLMNALLPLLLFSLAFMIPHDVVVGKTVVEEVAAGSPAEMAGFLPQDTIISVGGSEVNSRIDVSRYIQLNLGNEATFLVEHSDLSTEEVTLIPRWRPPEGEGAIGVTIGTVDASIVKKQQPFWEAIPSGVNECIETFVLFKNAILGLFIGTYEFEVGGPVAIAQISGEVAQAGISPLLQFTAFFSINLAIINLLPLPALDGGRIAFVLLEWVRRGKRISPQKEGRVHMIGFALLIGLMLAVTYQDIIRIIGGQSLLP